AIVGGRSYAQSQFNRAIKAQRQPGSAFKPFVYLAALESGLTPETTVYDLPVTIGDWSPRNASGRFEGAMPLERGISKSVNTVAVRLQQQLGPDAVIQSARRLGIQSKLRRDPTLALGTSEVSTLEMTAAYATLANGGLKVGPHVIRRVRTHSGRLLFAPSARSSPRVLAGETVGQMSRMLSAVVERGTGRRAAIANHPAAGKTGTTQDARDAWFVGYTRHLTAGIWIGQDGRGPSLTGLSGGTLPAEVWRDVMAFAHDDLRPLPLAWYGGAKARPLTSRAKLKPKSKPKPKSRPTPVAKRRPTRRPKTLATRRVPVAQVTPRRRTRTQTAPRLAERTAIFARRIPALPKRRPTRVVRRKAPARAIAPPRVPVANPSLDQRFIADAIRETERLETRKLARSELERTRRARQFDAEAIRRMLAEAQSPAGPAPVPSRYRRPQTLMGLGKPP
ncbi:MAG: penicillin-binding transpeptidase domain-containing protein, partial [Pseudomonadota bacterium]